MREELQLDTAQIESLDAIRRSMRDDGEVQELFARLGSAGSDEERQAIFRELRSLTDKKVNSVLRPDQVTRVQELALQRAGMRALGSPEIVAALGLTDEQQAGVQTASDAYSEARQKLFAPGIELSGEERDAMREKLQQDFESKLSSVLTAPQKQQFEKRLGKSFEFAQGDGRGPRPAPTQVAAPPVAVQAPPIRPASVAVPSVTVAADGDEPATTSFGALPKNGAPVKVLSFNFRFAPWTDVLELFAEVADLTLDLTEVPPGSFNYYDNGTYSPTEALDIINGYLQQRGFLLVRRDQFLVVVNVDRPIPPNLVPTVTIEEVPKRGRNELMTVLLPLNGLTPDDVAAEVEQLLGPWGKVVPLSKTGKVVVTDIGYNILRIHELLSGITIEVGDKLFKQFSLEHIAALDAEIVIRDVFGLQPRNFQNVSAGVTGSSRSGSQQSRFSRDPRAQQPQPVQSSATDPKVSVTVAVDERTNSLLITASPANMKIVEEAITSIDVEPLAGFSRSSREPYFHVYQLDSADPIEVTKTLNVLFPGTVVNEDGRTRRIHILATPQQHTEIESTIRRLDGVGGGSMVAVIPLGRMDSYTATASIQSLFLLDGAEAPVVQPHPTGNGLIVRGSSEQVEQIKLLIAELDPEGGGGFGGTGNVRTIPLGGRDPTEFVEALERIWNVNGRNRIRTVIPSSRGTIRGQRVPSAVPETAQPIRPVPLGPVGSGASSAGEGEASLRPSRNIYHTSNPFADAQAELVDVAAREVLAELAARTTSDVELEELNEEPPVDLNAEFDRVFQTLDRQDAESATATPVDDSQPPAAAEGTGAPIAVTISGGNLIIVSDDTEALDRLEETISSLSQAMPPRTQWTVFYLQSADATSTAQILERLFPTSSVSTSSTSSGGFLSELSGGLSSMGRGVMDLTGLNTLMTGPQTLRIIPDTRSNSLFVTGPANLVNEVEDTLQILDASELPEQLRAKAPRYIPVFHADVGDVAEIIRDVYKEEMNPPQQQQQRGQNPIAAIMGGGNQGGSPATRVTLTLGVDYGTSRLIVSCSEPMYLQIEDMVHELDRAALEARKTTRIVSLKNASSSILQQTLGELMPKVKVSRSSTSGRSSGSGTQPQSQQQPSQSGSSDADRMRQFFMQRMQDRARQGGSPGSGGGSGRGGGPSGGGNSGRGSGSGSGRPGR